MSFLSYVSRINIEIGRSFIHRSFPRRIEYLYLSEWGRQARDETRKTLRRLGSRFLSPFLPFVPVSPFEFLPLSLFFVTYLSSHFRRGASRGISALLFRSLLFAAFYTNPLFVYPWLLLSPLFVSHFTSVRRRRSILSGRSSLDHWPGRKLEHVSTL